MEKAGPFGCAFFLGQRRPALNQSPIRRHYPVEPELLETMMAQDTPANRISRRDFLFVSAVAGGVLAVGLASTPAAASTKMSPKAMQYRPTPNGNQRCDNCKNWQAPGACRLVDGPIAASGWCMLYNPKS